MRLTFAARARARWCARAACIAGPSRPTAAPEAPESAAVAPEAPELDEEDETVAAVARDAALAEINSGLIPMTHPDGGTCDRYGTDADGNILVPANEAAGMFDHGFTVVSSEA